MHGVTLDGVVDYAGRTDAAITRDLLMLAGVAAEAIDERWEEVKTAAAVAYARLCPEDLSDRVAPGMVALLDELSARTGDFRLSLVTGNLEPIARLKLHRAGLGDYFARGQGAFGSDSEDRTELPAVARRRAGKGDPYPRTHTAVIGDTPLDIACARADGVRAVAVATGPYSVDDLRAADDVAVDASDLRGVLQRLL